MADPAIRSYRTPSVIEADAYNFNAPFYPPHVGRSIAIGGMPVREVELIDQVNELTDQLHNNQYQLQHDQLTGLLNREGFNSEVGEILNQEQPVLLAFLDLDHFKKVNDKLGHDKGDILLQEIALFVSGSLRDSDLVARAARNGGDEFLVAISLQQREGKPLLSYEERAQGALRHLENIINQFLSHPDHLELVKIGLNVSMGTTNNIGAPNKGLPELIKEADRSMYVDKRRNHARAVLRKMRLGFLHLFE